MDQKHSLFSDQSGVYWIPSDVEAAGVKQVAQERKFRFIDLNGAGVTNRQELFQLVRVAFDFPAHFGGNWDALLDMLRDLSWLPANGYMVFAHNLEPLSTNDHASYDHFLGVLHDAATFWAGRMQDQRPVIVLLAGVFQA